MAGGEEDADLHRRLAALEAQPALTVDTQEIAGIVDAVLESLSGDLSVADLRLYRELDQIADVIRRAKHEIAQIQPHDISEKHIPMATDELDAVIASTAEATGTILDVVETFEKLVPTMPKEMGDTVAAGVTRIYEACNFQDITGQRITKVVSTLKHIEAKVNALLAAFGETARAARAPAPPAFAEDDDRRLMNGPQLPAVANSQDDIDAILAELDAR